MKKLIVFALISVCVLALTGCFSVENTNNDNAKLFAINNIDHTIIDQTEAAEWAISRLKNEIVYEDKDTLTYFNGYLETIDIKSKDTAEMLFACIRNCSKIVDYTEAALAPEHLPILINGKEIGTFGHIYMRHPETEQFLCFVFKQEDSTAFYAYVMGFKE